MPYEARATRAYGHSATAVSGLAAQVIVHLSGKLLKQSDAAAGHLEANFDRQIQRRAFGNRVRLLVDVAPRGAGQCTLSVGAYPVDPVGRKLMFGVRGDPARLVITTFLEEMDRRLQT